MKKLILSAVLLILFVQIVFPQTIGKDKKDEISPELKKEAVAFLRETATDVNTLRSLENRISFASETANLMWFNDEKEARAMFQTVINDFRQLLTQYNAQAVTAGVGVDMDENESYLSSKNDISRKFSKALGVRQQIATSLAENDAQLAFDFLTDTAQTVTAAVFRKQVEDRDGYFQTRLIAQIAEQNPDTALNYGRKTLAKGFSYQHIDVLKKIYAKDPEKGAAFGEDVVQKLKSGGNTQESSFYLPMVLSLGIENQKKIKESAGKTPMFSEQALRDIAEVIAQQMLKNKTTSSNNGIETLDLIEQVLPSRAAQIRLIADSKSTTKSSVRLASGSAIALPSRNEEKQLMENVQNLDTKQLSKEERQKAVGQARKIIAGIKEPTARLFALSALASQIATAGDKELALQIMDDARNTVNLQPKNYQDFLQVLLLASGYAQIDADKAFPVLEDTIFRINDTIAAAIKVAEFMDTNNEIIEDNEVQIGSFGGGMTREIMRGLGPIETTIRSLAKSDFARTKALTNKFDRPEARILAKMLVLRGIFGNKKEAVED
jgi:hypothetical protein